ncbi:hypothetical protein CH341_21985 [Rhodoplanes roseus]|uniref:Uncharacterized protein n=1 Tax=Rhodoplanes roseus TaxID=29409 RepID=A0A327KUY0_9BRAD|nr:hypothetical protein CH341_21985 [Rhodoplanes roseus]
MVLLCVLFAGMIAATILVEQSYNNPNRKSLTRPTGPREVSHVGTIQLAPGRDGRCPQYSFDNKTGWVAPSGLAPCDPFDQPMPTFGGNGTDRMDTIREGFRRR